MLATWCSKHVLITTDSFREIDEIKRGDNRPVYTVTLGFTYLINLDPGLIADGNHSCCGKIVELCEISDRFSWFEFLDFVHIYPLSEAMNKQIVLIVLISYQIKRTWDSLRKHQILLTFHFERTALRIKNKHTYW